MVHFFQNDALKTAIKGEIVDAKPANEIIFTLSAETKDEMNAWANEVWNAGETIIGEPEEFGKDCYVFVFADPDGHKWKVFYM